MKVIQNLIIFLVFLMFFSSAAQPAIAQDEMIQPADFFQNFPKIKWGMSIEKAKTAIEQTGNRASRPVESQLTWSGKFNDMDGQGALVFAKGKSLEAVIVQLYYSDNGRQMYESWVKRLTEKHGRTKEETLSKDVTLRRWTFKTGFFLELRLIKDDGEDRYMAVIHWERK